MKPQIFNSNILEIKDVTPSVKYLKLSVPETLKDFEFKAGQYFSLSVSHEGKKFRKPFSVINVPSENDRIEFLIKLIPSGLASEFVKKLKVGDEVELFGPAGRFVVPEDCDDDLVFIASGVGVAPFVSMIRSVLENRNFKKKIILMKSARNEDEILYDELFDGLRDKYENFEFYNVLSKPNNTDFENIGYVQDFLEKYIPTEFDGTIYVCGRDEMINDVKKKLIGMNVDESRINTESFD